MQRALEWAVDMLEEVPNGAKRAAPDKGKALKAGAIAAGGLAGLTAASAGISSLRRRMEGAESDS